MWTDEMAMRKFVQANGRMFSNHTFIAAIVEMESAVDNDQSIDALPNCSSLGPTWSMIGYDVITSGMLSVLQNFGLGKSNHRRFIEQIPVEAINPNHLFDSYDAAKRLQSLSRQSLVTHAPFYIVAIFTSAVNSAL